MRNGPSWGKKQKHCDPLEPEDEAKGDQWDHTAIDVDSRFVVSLVIGKRNGETRSVEACTSSTFWTTSSKAPAPRA